MNQSAPLFIITGIFARVSTLLTFVGYPLYPCSAGNGGFVVGSPLCPSIEWISAVSSPHTNAPAPYFISISNSKPELNIFVPKTPLSFASSKAILSLFIARGYSALMYTRPLVAPIAYPQIAIASIIECGSPSRIDLSMNAPGSPSSALHTTYF